MDWSPPSGAPYRELLGRPRGLALVIDDDPHLAAVIDTLLSQANFDVVVASQGREALTMLGLRSDSSAPIRPELILLDYRLPDMTGVEILGRLRQNERTRALPVIMMSSTHEDIRDMVEGDVEVFLKKPFANQVLLRAIMRALGIKS